LAKVAELAGQGEQVSFRTLQRLRRGYEREGLWALVDRRFARLSSATGRADERVVAAMLLAIGEQTHQSTGTATRVRRRVQQILTAEHGPDAPPMPSERTFYRLFASLSAGKHPTGSTRTRQSIAKRPDRPFGTVVAVRPGEWTQIDSTPLNVRVVLDGGETDRVELTWMIDLATRTIPAAVLRPTTKAADAAVLLAKAMTPEPMRPGRTDALRMSRSVLPHRRLTDLDERLEHAAARPVIVPETIVCDHGKAYISRTFQNACRAMGINFQPPTRDLLGRRATSSAASTRWTRCSRSTSPATSGPASSGGAGTRTRTRSGRWPSCRRCWTSGSSAGLPTAGARIPALNCDNA
jgi:hypothetical protein